jgi:hypothetical protein
LVGRVEVRRIVVGVMESDDDPEEPAELWYQASLRMPTSRRLIAGLRTNTQAPEGCTR